MSKFVHPASKRIVVDENFWHSAHKKTKKVRASLMCALSSGSGGRASGWLQTFTTFFLFCYLKRLRGTTEWSITALAPYYPQNLSCFIYSSISLFKPSCLFVPHYSFTSDSVFFILTNVRTLLCISHPAYSLATVFSIIFFSPK